MPVSEKAEEIEVFLRVLKYIVRIVVQIRMASLERHCSVKPVSVPVHVFKGYLADAASDENSSILVHPDVAAALNVHTGAWVWTQCSLGGPKTLSKLVTTELVGTSEALMSDALFFNITRGLCDSAEIVVSPSLLEKLPKAVSFDFSIQKCPKGWDASDIDSLMVEYFKRPRPVGPKNIFSVSVRDYSPELFYSKLSLEIGSESVWFKVEELVAESGHKIDPERRMCFQVSKEQTRVALVLALDGGLPGRLNIFLEHTDSFLELETAVKLFLKPEIFKVLHKGKGLLLSGKTCCDELYRAVAESLGLHLVVQNCRELNLPAGNVGQIEGKIKQLVAQASTKSPSLLVLENIEVLGHDHESSNSEGEDFRLTNSLSLVLSTIPSGQCAVLGVTSKPKSIVPSISRSWLTAADIPIQYANESKDCLKHYLARVGFYQTEINFNVPRMGARDLRLFARKAIESKMKSGFFAEMSENIRASNHEYTAKLGRNFVDEDWKTAIGYMNVSNQETAANIPKVYWEDIGGLEEVRKEVLRTVSLPIKFPFLRKSGLKRSGILLYGPPGTGKTLVAKAVATECGLSFISVKGAELLSMYVGQSEENVRDVFIRARQVAPSVIFFDELDALAPARGQGGDGGGNVSDRVVSQLMAEMDGIEQNLDTSKENSPVFVMAATNRVDLVESALLRPGRFDKLMYVGPCKTDEAKLGVLKALTRKFQFCNNVRLEEVIQHVPEVPLTGADIYGMCADAWKIALRHRITQIQRGGTDDKSPVQVSMDDFVEAATNIRTSVSPEELLTYEMEAQKQSIQ